LRCGIRETRFLHLGGGLNGDPCVRLFWDPKRHVKRTGDLSTNRRKEIRRLSVALGITDQPAREGHKKKIECDKTGEPTFKAGEV